MTAQMMPVAKQEEIVIRISGFTTHYLKSNRFKRMVLY